MIRISFAILVIIYLVAFLAVVSALWLVYETRSRRKHKRTQRHRLRCNTCGLEFEDFSDSILPKCPRCATLNERERPNYL